MRARCGPESANRDAATAQGEPLPSSSTSGLQSEPQIGGQPAEVIARPVEVDGGHVGSRVEELVTENEASFGFFYTKVSQFAFCNYEWWSRTGSKQVAGLGISNRRNVFSTYSSYMATKSYSIASKTARTIVEKITCRSKSASAINTPTSSSVPAEAIQAEVQRQLGTLLDRLSQAEMENQRLQEALTRERIAGASGRQPLPHDRRGEGVNENARREPVVDEREDPRVLGQGLRADEGVTMGAVSRVATDPLAALWEGISGRLGARPKVGAVNADSTSPDPTRAAKARGSATNPEDPERPSDSQVESAPGGVIETLAQSMKQLQDLQLKALKKDEASGLAPEVVKTATVSLPLLPDPEGETSGLLLQDWLVQVTTLMQDLSTNSAEWWEEARESVASTYSAWLSSSPLERLQVVPRDHEKLATGRWMRVNARACALMMQALPEPVKLDLIARRFNQSAVLVLFRLFTTYQPGGAGERAVVLKHLQGTDVPADLAACLSSLRSWPRWLQRCRDLNMVVPDGSLLARGLTAMTAKHLGENPDAVFRTQVVRSTYRVDAQPRLDDVIRYQQHLQAEIENIMSARASTKTAASPTVKSVTTTGAPTSPTSPKDVKPCKYFLRSTGCRRGAKCPFGHSLEGLSKQEKFRKCLACGSEEHRQRDCPTKVAKSSAAAPTTRAPEKAGSVAKAQTAGVSVVQAEPEGESSPAKAADPAVAQGQPVLSWEALLQAAAKVAGMPPEAKAPSMNVVSISAVGSHQDEARALVDSGATHPLRRAKSEQEWQDADPVVVHLAGGEQVELRMNKAGTLLVPITANPRATSSAPIVPLGSLVGMLGYTMEWSRDRCKLIGREGDSISLRVRDGCPEVTEAQALGFISRIEDKKLEQLKKSVVSSKQRIREAVIAINKTWFDHLLTFCDSGAGVDSMMAVQAAPFFRDVPQQALFGITEAVAEDNGWDALRGLTHLNRRTRKRLWGSRQWVVHLFAG